MKAPQYCDTWDPDPDLPEDHRGRSTCRNCHRIGEAGDARHTPPPPPTPRKAQPDWRAEAAMARDAAVLGEDDREEYR